MPSLSTNQRSVILPFIDNAGNHRRDWQIGLPLRGHLILLITRMITDQIELHWVLLPLFIKTITKYSQTWLVITSLIWALIGQSLVMLVIGWCNSTVKGTVNMSCPCKWTQCFICMCCCLAFYDIMKMYNQCPVCNSNFVVVLINWLHVVQFCP